MDKSEMIEGLKELKALVRQGSILVCQIIDDLLKEVKKKRNKN